MSYSCTSRGNSQEPATAKKPVGNNRGRDTGGTASSGNGSPKQAMRVKKGYNSTEVVPLTIEEDLHGSPVITPEDVLGLQKITESKFTVGVWVTLRRAKLLLYESCITSYFSHLFM